MSKRILNWHFTGNPDMLACYAEEDYSPEHIRLYSPNALGAGVCEVDIRDDGVSILEDYAKLSGEQTLEELAGNFASDKPTIEQGSVITCHIVDPGGASSLSIQLEMESLADEDEEAN